MKKITWEDEEDCNYHDDPTAIEPLELLEEVHTLMERAAGLASRMTDDDYFSEPFVNAMWAIYLMADRAEDIMFFCFWLDKEFEPAEFVVTKEDLTRQP